MRPPATDRRSPLQNRVTPFGELAIEERVSSLLAEPVRGGRTGVVLSVVAAVATVLLLSSFEVHHLTETLLGLLTH